MCPHCWHKAMCFMRPGNFWHYPLRNCSTRVNLVLAHWGVTVNVVRQGVCVCVEEREMRFIQHYGVITAFKSVNPLSSWHPCSKTMPPPLPHSTFFVFHLSLHSLIPLPLSFYSIFFWVGMWGSPHLLLPTCCPIVCVCVWSVRFHLFPNKSKQLVTDWNTAFCCFPCCTDNSHTYTHTVCHCYAPMLPDTANQWCTPKNQWPQTWVQLILHSVGGWGW